ncbi:fMet-Leu-Phe receptor [Biomphalaria glabrata]|uniref:G-protein coupled receptors family 1 profile domain-containing protein n=1 Tax=Biomphalaria glabrata TaxID=6526 RepID=A0A2C9KU91_BIOGL|nr:fMet-Leu-Phe receptor-like [Biomphalaria glabrata]KAI8784858.1 fMet-Leu-Phe receptor [Biomphalaria glabrata]
MERNDSNIVVDQVIHADWLVSDFVRSVVEIVLGVSVSTVIAVLGIVGNVINILVYCKQGLTSSVNISFTLLAVTDLGSLLTLLWWNVCGIPEMLSSGIPFSFSEVKHLSAGFPHACFSRVTSWIIVHVLLERCICVLSPFKVKTILTPARTAVVIALVYLVMILTLVPEYSSMYLSWKFYPQSNRTLLGLVLTSSWVRFKGVSLFLYGVYMLASFTAVPTLTCILVIVYTRQARWRSGNTSHSCPLTSRDRRAVKMVLAVGLVFSATYSFTVVLIAIGKSVPGFDLVGIYANLFLICFTISFVLDASNSSIHFVLYYKTSSKYRETFRSLFQKALDKF